MKTFYKIFKTGISVSDLSIKIGDIEKVTLCDELKDLILNNAAPVYIDQNSTMQEHLYDNDSLEKIQPCLHSEGLQQLNEIFGFMNSRGLAYVRFI